MKKWLAPILLGNEKIIRETIDQIGYEQKDFQVVDPKANGKLEIYAHEFYKRRQRKGATLREAKSLMSETIYYGSMMVAEGEADAMISGLTTHYPNTIKPALQCVGIKEGFQSCKRIIHCCFKK